MTTPEVTTELNPEKRIYELEKSYAVMDVRFQQINQNISEIKNNHLLHINDQLTVMSKIISDNNVSLVALVNAKIGEVYSKLTELKITDAKQEPTNSILNKVIEYVIMAVVGAGVVFLLTRNK